MAEIFCSEQFVLMSPDPLLQDTKIGHATGSTQRAKGDPTLRSQVDWRPDSNCATSTKMRGLRPSWRRRSSLRTCSSLLFWSVAVSFCHLSCAHDNRPSSFVTSHLPASRYPTLGWDPYTLDLRQLCRQMCAVHALIVLSKGVQAWTLERCCRLHTTASGGPGLNVRSCRRGAQCPGY